METVKKLFLLDAFALIYRAYFAFANNQRVNSKGLNTSAILGFTNTLTEVIRKEKPTHIAVVFDTAAATSRHEEFEDYKAHREEMPEDLRLSIPYIYQLIEAFNIPSLFMDGYEADDLIGTLAKKAEQQGFVTYMMTPDKDYGQLVSDHIFMFKPARMGNGVEVLGVAEICKKWDILNVNQVIDILGLMGDKADNIPGIPGVGEKTAIQLIKDFGSVENLLDNTHQLKGKLKEKVEENKEKAILSKKLATIICDAPIELNPDELALKEPNYESLRELFNELEFRRLADQILGERSGNESNGKNSDNAALSSKETKAKAAGQTNLFDAENSVIEANDLEEEFSTSSKIYQSIDTVKHTYSLIDTAEKRTELLHKLKCSVCFCFDTETTSLNVMNAEIVGISFSILKNEAYYIPFGTEKSESIQILSDFKDVFEDPNIEKVGQNMKYDISVLRNYGVEVKGKKFDTMIAHYILQPDMRHSMNVLSETYLNYSPVSIEKLIGPKGKNQLSMRDVEIESIKEYACEDADITLQLKEAFEPLLKKNNSLGVFDNIEMPLMPVLADMEAEGINIDIAALRKFSIELKTDIEKIQNEIYALAGTTFNIASPKQLGEILFDYLKITDKAKKTKTGQYATGEDVLEKLGNTHPIVDQILIFREFQKLKNTYVDPLPEMLNQKTGKIHTSFNQVVAATGRLSSDKPNLQNIPIRTTKGREVRKAFIPRNDEFIILSADYSQIELRIIAELSQDEGMMEAFSQQLDIHSATAAKIFNVELDAVDREMRSKAKAVNFGISYGQTAFGLSQTLNIPRKESAEIINNYFAKYPKIRDLMDKNIEFARQHGFVETMLGRKRYLRDINDKNQTVRSQAERNAINAPIQGSAADMIKIAMVNIDRTFKENQFKSKMILQVHDELVFDVFIPELEIVKPIIQESMQKAVSMKVPILVEMGVGKNWLEAH